MTDEPRGYFTKYRITKADTGEEVTGPTFTLRPDRDPHAEPALLAYANSVRRENPKLANDLEELAGVCRD